MVRKQKRDKPHFYAVRQGRERKIYQKEDLFLAQMRGLAHAEGQTFSTLREAEAYQDQPQIVYHKFYAVACGYATGIFPTSEAALAQTKFYPGALYQRFYHRDQAEAYLRAHGITPDPGNPVHPHLGPVAPNFWGHHCTIFAVLLVFLSLATGYYLTCSPQNSRPWWK